MCPCNIQYPNLLTNPQCTRITRHLHNPVTIFLISGIKLTGVVDEVDEAALTLTGRGVSQDVFFQAIATIMPTP